MGINILAAKQFAINNIHPIIKRILFTIFFKIYLSKIAFNFLSHC